MSQLSDIVDLIAATRREVEKIFDSEVQKLRLTYGPAMIETALRLEKQRDEMSIVRGRERERQAGVRRKQMQKLFRKQHNADEWPDIPPLPSGWR
jgi:hypothetical protein